MLAPEVIQALLGEQLFYYHPDHLGSTSYVTRENGKLHEHLQYFPFGETWVQQGGNTEKSPYLFTSKELDEETGLYYFGARFYDPRTSVWVSADPIDRFGPHSPTIGLNLYQYGLLNPVRYTDPTGLDEEEGIFSKISQKYEDFKAYLSDKSVGWFRDARREASEAAYRRAGDDPELASAKAEEDANAAAERSQAEARKFIDSAVDGAAGGKAIGILGSIGAKLGLGVKKAAEGTIPRSRSLRKVGDLLESVDDVIANPNLLSGKSPAQVEAIIGKTPGWRIETLGKGSHKGQGWVFREYTPKGDPTGRPLRWHPGGGHHGPEPYWRVTGGPYGKSDIIR